MDTLSRDAQALIRCKQESDRARWVDRVKMMSDATVSRLLAAEIPIPVPVQPIVAQLVVPPEKIHKSSMKPERRPRKRLASHYTPLEGKRRELDTEKEIVDDHRVSVVMEAAQSMTSLHSAATIKAAVNAAAAQQRALTRHSKAGVGSVHAKPFKLTTGVEARFKEICAEHSIKFFAEPCDTLEFLVAADDDGGLR